MNQELKRAAGDLKELSSVLVQLVRLALSERNDELRLYIARLVRRLRSTDEATANQLETLLKSRPAAHPVTSFRRGVPGSASAPVPEGAVPMDEESRLSLLKVFRPEPGLEAPMHSEGVRQRLEQLISERRRQEHLAQRGLAPSRSAVFVGRPGVGKTMTARWLATQLDVPLFVLDLTAVMSSLLGRSGTNLRSALDYAKSMPCVLLLDELDAIAKRRSDDADIGELKRLVTVILQEVDEWPSSGLLLAATNHPELIDPALWRRFDLVIEFDMPSPQESERAIERFLGSDSAHLKRWIPVLAPLYRQDSYSDIEREIHRFRRSLVLGDRPESELIVSFVREKVKTLGHADRIDLAVTLVSAKAASQHVASDLTGVSRDTIRKRLAKG